MDELRTGRRRLALAFVVAALVVLAGCGAFAGDGADPGNATGDVGGAEPVERPAVFESATRDLDEDTTESLWRAVSSDGSLTADGERLLDGLARLDSAERGAVAASVNGTSLDGGKLEKLETAVDSPAEIRRDMLGAGLVDTSGDGLLDGEAELLGVDPAEPRPRVADAAAKLAPDGYGGIDVEFLRRVGSLDNGGFAGQQATALGLVTNATANGTVTENDVRAISDRSGDGLLSGAAAALGLDPDRRRARVAGLAEALATDGYEREELAYLRAVATISGNEAALAQARYLGLLNDTADRGVVDRATVDSLRATEAGTIAGFAERIGLNNRTANATVAALSRNLSSDGYGDSDVAFLARVATLSESAFGIEQARALGLLSEPTANGTATPADLDRLADTSGDGLLDSVARRLGLDPAVAQPVVVEFAQPLAVGGYDRTEFDYLERIDELSAYRGHDYEVWQQATQLGLLDAAVENGTVTDRQLWALRNNASNRLLNGMEVQFGTDPEAADTSGDGLLDSVARRLGLDPAVAQPVVVEFAQPLAVGGYDRTEFDYLERIDELSAYRGHDYEVWQQATQLGLLDAAVENGTVTDRQLWALRNNASNRLLNGMEVQFGTDPEAADTSGDGYADHLAWGPLRDLGLPVTPGEVDIYVELDTVEGQAPPDADQRGTVQSTFRTEPPDAIGPINVHFRQCADDRDSVSGTADLRERIGEYREATGLGFHYMLINDGPLEFEGQRAAGLTYIARQEPSWIVVDGTIDDRGGAEYEPSTIAHELGHSFGVFGDDFAGVDSREYTSAEYTSVMNYNHWTPVTFSSGEPFDDFERMAEQSFGSYHQDRSALEEMWEDGEADTGALCS
jgi:hypothetical protein